MTISISETPGGKYDLVDWLLQSFQFKPSAGCYFQFLISRASSELPETKCLITTFETLPKYRVCLFTENFGYFSRTVLAMTFSCSSTFDRLLSPF